LPQLYVVMLVVGAGVACGVNWMLKPDLLAELVHATSPKVVVTLGRPPATRSGTTCRQFAPRSRPGAHSYVPVQADVMPETDFDMIAARQPGDRLLFERNVEHDHIAAYVHSGDHGSPKL